jgi:hypothetical protein
LEEREAGAMKRFVETSVIGPTGMDTLQQCFDKVLAQTGQAKDSPAADRIAHSLISAYQRGLRHHQDLVLAAGWAAGSAEGDTPQLPQEK